METSHTVTSELSLKDDAFTIAICALKTVAFQGLSVSSEVALTALKKIEEILKQIEDLRKGE